MWGIWDNSAAEFHGISQIVPWNLAKFAVEKEDWPCWLM